MKTPRGSTAVMARRIEPPDSLDYFPTPGWGTRAIIEKLIGCRVISSNDTDVIDPCCGSGHMARPLNEYFDNVHAADVFNYGYGLKEDFLDPAIGRRADWYFLNPPFKAGPAFVLKALERARHGVAALVRTSFLEGGDRYETIYQNTPPTGFFQFSERLIMAKGICRNPDLRYWHINPKTGQGEWRMPSTATAYCWMFWHRGSERMPPDWIEPGTRRRLQKLEDYDPHEQPPVSPMEEIWTP